MSAGASFGAWQTYERVCGYVSMSTEAKSRLKCVHTRSQMIEAVRSELSCDRGTVSAVARVIYELIRHHQPLSCGGGGMVPSIISSLPPPPSIIWFCVQIYYHPVCHFNMFTQTGFRLLLFFRCLFWISASPLMQSSVRWARTRRKTRRRNQGIKLWKCITTNPWQP